MSLNAPTLRRAFRSLWRQPALTAAVVVPLALALAINTALFSVLDGLLLRPLPFKDSDRLVAIDFRDDPNGQPPALAYLPELSREREVLRDQVESALAGAAQAMRVTPFDESARELGIEPFGVDSRFFGLLGLTPIVGSDFGPEDERDSEVASRLSRGVLPVILGYGLWQRLYGGDPDVLGVRELAGRQVRIVGVMGPGVKFPDETNLWTPLPPVQIRPPAYGRLVDGGTVEQLALRVPSLRVRNLRDIVRPGESRAVVVMFGVSAILLLVAWVQVGGFLVSRSVTRVHEFGVRLALGARRVRLIRECLAENAVPAGVAFLLAWTAVPLATEILIAWLPAQITRGQYLTPSARTFVFSCGAALVGVAVLTVLPIGLTRFSSPLAMVKGQLGDLPVRANRLRRILLLVQIGLTSALLYVCGLTVHTFVRVVTHDYGFDANNVLLFTPQLPNVALGAGLGRPTSPTTDFFSRYEDKLRRIDLSVERLANIRGVVGAAAFYQIPLVPISARMELWDEVVMFNGRHLAPTVRARGNIVSRGFVRALGARVIEGGDFADWPPQPSGETLILVNETFANALTPAATVLGSPVRIGLIGAEMRTNRRTRGRIVGVVRDLVYASAAEQAVPQFFQLNSPHRGGPYIAIRTDPSVEQAVPAVRAALHPIWGDVPPRDFALLRDAWNQSVVPFRGQAMLLTMIAASCLPIAAIGLAGAMFYAVRVRRREIAIRMVLGAEPADVQRSIVLWAATTVAVGLVAGTLLGAIIGRLMGSQLFGVQAADPWTMATVAVIFLGVTWLVAQLPARAASRTAPSVALREV